MPADIDELIEVYWLDDVAIYSQLIALGDVRFFAREEVSTTKAGMVCVLGSVRICEHFDSIDERQLQIEQRNQLRAQAQVSTFIRPVPNRNLNCLPPVSGHVNVIRELVFLECMERQLHILKVVLDQKYFDRALSHKKAPGCLENTIACRVEMPFTTPTALRHRRLHLLELRT